MKSYTRSKDHSQSFGRIYEEFLGSLGGYEGGAILTFTGTVRGDQKKSRSNGITTRQIEIEAIDDVSSEHLQRIADDVEARPGIKKVTIIHFTGTFELGEPMVHVLICSEHRNEGFKALEDVVNRYKKETPLWKREIYSDGSSHWISH